MSDTYTVRARRWSGGWELHIDGVGLTQVATLARAEGQVRDYLATLYDVDTSAIVVDVVPALGGLEEDARAAREQAVAAEDARREATRRLRDAALRLREAGLSVTDCAQMLKTSRGRVSQLVGNAGDQGVIAEGQHRDPARVRVIRTRSEITRTLRARLGRDSTNSSAPPSAGGLGSASSAARMSC